VGDQRLHGPPRPVGRARAAAIGAAISAVAFVLLAASITHFFVGDAHRSPDTNNVEARFGEPEDGWSFEINAEWRRGEQAYKRTTTWLFFTSLSMMAAGTLLGYIAWRKKHRTFLTLIALWPVGLVFVLIMILGSLPSA
jgi:hypothetical protein